jgi:hypothetical protein
VNCFEWFYKHYFENENVLNSPDGNENPMPLRGTKQSGVDCNGQQDESFLWKNVVLLQKKTCKLSLAGLVYKSKDLKV